MSTVIDILFSLGKVIAILCGAAVGLIAGLLITRQSLHVTIELYKAEKGAAEKDAETH